METVIEDGWTYFFIGGDEPLWWKWKYRDAGELEQDMLLLEPEVLSGCLVADRGAVRGVNQPYVILVGAMIAKLPGMVGKLREFLYDDSVDVGSVIYATRLSVARVNLELKGLLESGCKLEHFEERGRVWMKLCRKLLLLEECVAMCA